jgi:phosphatidylinositol-3-phosphatase
MLSGGHSAPVGVVAAAAGTPPHIMVIVDENKGYSAAQGAPFIIGNTGGAPYINNTLAATYTSATNWFSNVHGSVADYEGMLAGAPAGGAGPTLVDELASAGISWKAYMEDMPTTCYRGSPVGNYDPTHNPFIDFTSITATSQCNNVVPYANAVSDLNSPSPPSFVWISPNVCNDMHTNGSVPPASCPSNAVATGDTWLANNIPTIMSSAWYRQSGVIIVAWDESNGGDTAGFNGSSGGHIATLVISANSHKTFSTGGNLFGILRGIESTYGVPYLGATADPANGDISAAFGQVPTTGSINGTVTDSKTNAVRAGATVSYSGGSATTGADGKYALTTVPPGTYAVTAAATGYTSTNHNVTVSAGVRSLQDFALAPAPAPPPPPPRPQNVGQPAVAVGPDGTQLVFWQGAGSVLNEIWYTGVWNGPLTFPQFGTMTSAPSVAVSKDGSTELVFWRGPGGHLLEAWYAGGGWNGPVDWTNAFGGVGPLASAPSVVTTADGQQLVFWQGTDGHLWEAWYAAGAWHGPVDWSTLGTLASPPSAIMTPDGSTQLVFWKGADNRLSEDWYTGSWNGPVEWTGLGSPTSAPSVTVTPDGSTQLVFYQGAGGHLLESWYAGSWNGPVDWTTSAFGGSGPLTSAPAAAVTPDGSTQLVFWQGAGSTLWEGWYAGGAWHGPVNFSS